MDVILSECLNAATEMSRHGGFASAQWVLSRLHVLQLRWVTKTNASTVVLCSHMLTDRPLSVFSLNIVLHQERLSYDGICGQRVRRAALRQAALVTGPCQVGDISFIL